MNKLLIDILMCGPLSWITVRYQKSVPVRILVRGTDFRYEIHWNGTWYGFSIRIFISTVPDTDFGMELNKVRTVRYVERIFVRNYLYRNGFFRYGSWYGAKFRKIEKNRKPFFKFWSVSPCRKGFFVPNSGPHSVPIKVPNQNPYSETYQ